MINNDRIVPIQKTDFLTLIGTVLALGGTSYTIGKPSDVEGDFSVAGSGSVGNVLCNQPVKSLDIPSGVTACAVYFVAGYDFTAITVAGAAPTFDSDHLDNDDVLADGVTLYKAVLSSGTVTLTAVTPLAS